jgi:4-nitrophenyl phosphatase
MTTTRQSEFHNLNSDLASFRFLITDMDGVLWRSKEPMPGLVDFFKFLREQSIKFMCATNNSSTAPQKIADRLRSFGTDVTPAEIVTSSSATADYLTTILPAGSKVYVIGLDGLRSAVIERGFAISEDDAIAVVVGIDWNLTYNQIKQAARLIRGGAKFIGTNADATFPAAEGIIPGAGSILAAIETASGVKPIVIGKPEAVLYAMAMQRMQAQTDQTVVLGDRLETDILGAVRLNLKSILVLSGVTTREQLLASDYQPDWVFEDITDLKNHWGRSILDHPDGMANQNKSA